VTKTVTYNTVSTNLTGTTECWITQNLGADREATSVTDPSDAAAGWYWEWDLKQGYFSSSCANSYGPDATWIIANDPCNLLLGQGWRIPTYAEWNTALNNGGWSSNYNAAYTSPLKLHLAGYGNFCTVASRGIGTKFWSSTQYTVNNTLGGDLYIQNESSPPAGSGMGWGMKQYGFLIRCVNP
jgi:hypothetical protein